MASAATRRYWKRYISGITSFLLDGLLLARIPYLCPTNVDSPFRYKPAPRQDDPPYRPGDSVAIFVPCYMDQFYPEAARAMVRVLKRLGVQVEFPAGQTCCGQPAFNSGYWDESRPVVRQFCKVFAAYRWIVCPSGSCSAMCRIFFPYVDSSEEVARVSRRVFEFSEFLVDILHATDTGASFPQKVALHAACHGRRELGVFEHPLTLLRSVRGLTYCELPNIEECCGFGGTFSVKLPGTSLAMGQSKVDNIVRSGAEVVVSGDVSCLMHVGGILQRNPATRHIRTMHLAEVLDAGVV